VFEELVSDLAQAVQLFRHHVPMESVPDPNLMAAGLGLAGVALAYWGAWLLRTIFVLGFMVLGGGIGSQVGLYLGIDVMSGLVLGAGIAGLLGHLFFRMWLATTAASVAVFLVLLVGHSRLMEEVQAYVDHRQGVGTNDYAQYLRVAEEPALSLQGEARSAASYFWNDRRDFSTRFLFAAGLAWILGLILALLLPKFTMVLGTAFAGVVLTGGALGLLAQWNSPQLWDAAQAHGELVLAGMGAMLITALWVQVRGRPARALAAPAAAPAAPAAPPAG
jgi:hypothetical protein